MIASRDPDLGAVFDGLMDQFVAISEAAVAQAQPVGAPPDRELVKAQAFAVVTFLGGFLTAAGGTGAVGDDPLASIVFVATPVAAIAEVARFGDDKVAELMDVLSHADR